MLFSDEDAPHLKKWIVKRLEHTSDADADVLADYVLALLHNGDEHIVRTEVSDFLKDGLTLYTLFSEHLANSVLTDSSLFVTDVFEAIQYKSYLPGAPPPPPKPTTPSFPTAPAFMPPNGPSAMYAGGVGALNGTQNGSRKRSFHEQAGNDMADAGNHQFGNGARNFKQPRRGGSFGRGGRLDTFAGINRGGPQFHNSPSIPPHSSPGFPNMPNMPLPGLPPLDPNDPLAAIVALQNLQQAMGFPIPGMPPNPFPLSSQTGQGVEYRSPSITRPHSQKLRCRDYDVNGFCARGNTCQFEHGSGSIFVPPVDGMWGVLDLSKVEIEVLK